MFRYGLPAVATLCIAFAAVSVVRSRPGREPAPPPEAPPVALYGEAVAGTGPVEASTENLALSTPVSGLCTHVYVKVGDEVKAGQQLFSLDDRHLQAELGARQQALAVARAQLDKLLRSPPPEEIPPVEARVSEAEQALADAKVQQELIESVTDKRAIRLEDVLRRRIATKAAEARLKQAKAELALLKAGAWAQDIKIVRAQVALAEREVQRVQTNIDRLTVTAPVDGQILQVNIRVGEYAPSGPLAKPLILFGNVGVLHIRADVDEHDAWRVQADAPAYATLRGNSSTHVPLQFVRFEPYVVPKRSLAGDSTERVDTRVLQVLYRFEREGWPIYVGQQMDVYIDASGASATAKATALQRMP
jgi:HlyD family secretion protein